MLITECGKIGTANLTTFGYQHSSEWFHRPFTMPKPSNSLRVANRAEGLSRQGPVERTERFHVIGSLKGRRFSDRPLAHTAFHECDGVILVLLAFMLERRRQVLVL